MKQNKAYIEETIDGYEDLKASVRSIACSSESWSSFVELTEEFKSFIFNSCLFDGVKIKVNYTIVTFNARHKKK